MKTVDFKTSEAAAIDSGATFSSAKPMEVDTISKHGRSSKSQMSRGNFKMKRVFFVMFAIVASVFMFSACEKDDEFIPTKVTARQSGSNITITWNMVSGATHYKVYRSSSTSGTFILYNSPSNTMQIDTNPLKGTNCYKVSAVNKNGEEGKHSKTVSVNFK